MTSRDQTLTCLHINFSSTYTQAQRLEEENRIRIEEDRRAAAALARDTFMLGNVGKILVPTDRSVMVWVTLSFNFVSPFLSSLRPPTLHTLREPPPT